MKRWYLLVVTICLLSLSSRAQTPAPARIHFLNLMIANYAEIKVAANEKKPIVIKFRTWVTVQSVSDSIGFVINNKAYFLHFEPGKQYYFVIQSTHTTRPTVTEKSEREFLLTAGMNSIKGPEEYVLTETSN